MKIVGTVLLLVLLAAATGSATRFVADSTSDDGSKQLKQFDTATDPPTVVALCTLNGTGTYVAGCLDSGLGAVRLLYKHSGVATFRVDTFDLESGSVAPGSEFQLQVSDTVDSVHCDSVWHTVVLVAMPSYSRLDAISVDPATGKITANATFPTVSELGISPECVVALC
eukprot:TRINITY_DN420_c0_g2_i5.p2 TRINITY_DN420_c0_g2~~TRINITY_DN420_c0_g2_i5.p2  ORF type:complete len:169 (-),score=48.92 TRINITY_DN420_c0_g2_i5:74-580(-)